MNRRKKIASDLKRMRRKYGRTLQDAANAVGISLEGYRKKELGRSGTTADDLRKLSSFYGLSIAEAFPSYKPTDEERNLARMISQIPKG